MILFSRMIVKRKSAQSPLSSQEKHRNCERTNSRGELCNRNWKKQLKAATQTSKLCWQQVRSFWVNEQRLLGKEPSNTEKIRRVYQQLLFGRYQGVSSLIPAAGPAFDKQAEHWYRERHSRNPWPSSHSSTWGKQTRSDSVYGTRWWLSLAAGYGQADEQASGSSFGPQHYIYRRACPEAERKQRMPMRCKGFLKAPAENKKLLLVNQPAAVLNCANDLPSSLMLQKQPTDLTEAEASTTANPSWSISLAAVLAWQRAFNKQSISFELAS